MLKHSRAPAILVLLIVVVLLGAYLIVSSNNAAMHGAAGETPSGFLH